MRKESFSWKLTTTILTEKTCTKTWSEQEHTAVRELRGLL